MDNIIQSVILYKRQSKEKAGIVKICLYDKTTKSQKYVSLGILINEKDFDKKIQRIKQSNHNYDEINSLIERKLLELSYSNNNLTLIKDNKTTFSNYAISFLNSQIEVGSHKKYNTIVKTFTRFLNEKGKNDIFLKEIDERLIGDFRYWIYNQTTLKSDSTKNKYLALLKAIINKAIRENYVNYLRHPFINISIKRISERKEWLKKEEVDKILDLELDIDKNPQLYSSWLMAQYQIFSQGSRVSDTLFLKISNIEKEMIRFTMRKTKKKMAIFINYEMQNIIISAFHLHDFNKETFDKLVEQRKKHVSNLESLYLEEDLKENVERDIDITKHHLLLNFNSIILEVRKHLSANTFIFKYFLKESDFEKTGIRFNKQETNQISSKTAIYNKHLKTIAKECGIHLTLTSHIFRHTYANMALNLIDDLYTISKTLGHATIKQTEEYLRDFDEKRVNDLNELLAKSLNKSKREKKGFKNFVKTLQSGIQ